MRPAPDTDKAVVVPDTAVQEPAEPVPADPKVRALARGFYWRKLIETGQRPTVVEIARTERVSAPHVGRLLTMTLMHSKKS